MNQKVRRLQTFGKQKANLKSSVWHEGNETQRGTKGMGRGGGDKGITP